MAWWRGDSVNDSTGSVVSTFRAAGKSGDGYVGSGFVFSGNNDALALPTSFHLTSQEFSVEAWIRRADTIHAGLPILAGEFFAGSANGFSFGLTDEGQLYISHIGVVNYFSTTAIKDTNWHHVAVTREGSNLRFYADGVLASTVACSVVFDLNGPYAIGGLGTPFAGISYGFLGGIDELAVYGRSLAEGEIAAIANAGVAGKCVGPTRLVTLPVVNPSFEALTGTDTDHFDAAGHLLDNHYAAFNFATPTGFNTPNALPGWSGTGAAGTFNPPASLFPGGVTDGQNTAWINIHGQLSQTLAETFQPGRIYQLSVDVGAPAGIQFPGYVIGLYANGQAVAEDNNSKTVASGGFVTATVIAALPAGSPAVGAPIEIRLGIPGSKPDQTDFDNVRLTVESPVVENLALTVAAPFTAQPNADFTVTFTVENQGTQPATGVVLTTPLPAGFTLVTNTASQGTSVGSGGALVTVLGTLPGGNSASVTLTGHGPAPASLLFHGQVTRDGTDAVLTDNQRNAGVEVLGPCSTAPAGLVAWLRADGNAEDVFSHTSSFTGTPRYAAGRTGQAFDFDGASEVVIADSPELNQSSFTIESWVYPTAVDGTVDIIANKETAYPYTLSDIQFEFGIKGPLNDPVPNSIPQGNLAFFLSGISGLPNNYGGWSDAQAAIPLNQWTHVALTVTPGTVTAYVNGAVTLSVTGLTGSPVVNNWPLKIGSRSTAYVTQTRPQDRFNGRIDEFSFYARALTATEVASVFQVGSAGKCVQTFPVTIVAPPASTTILAGADATFSVAATGTGPLSYQWQFKGTNIVGATNAQWVVTGARKPAAGAYSVTVCNALGCVSSEPATLTITPAPALVQVPNVSVKSPLTVTVPVNLVGNGDENAVSFSLRFSPQLLTFLELTPGAGAANAQVLANTTGTNGQIGVAIALPAGTTFPEGTNQLLNLTFRSVLTNANRTSVLLFGDTPTERELVDAAAKPLEVVWDNGAVAVTPADYEGDVTPRPNGDRRLALADWVQVGRFVAALDEPSTETTEFQRADSAPLSSGGNGLLTVSDWVQAGRFAVALDAIVPAAGPLAPVPPAPNATGIVRHGLSERAVRLTGNDFLVGKTGQVAVVLASNGEENALAFSVQFDPAVLRFVSATAGAGAGTAAFNLNAKQAESGRIGLALALSVPNKFAAGDRELARLQFVPVAGEPGPAGLTFTDIPVVREVASPTAEVLSSGWQTAALAVIIPSLGVSRVETAEGTAIELSWPAALTGASLQSSGETLSGGWQLVPGLITIRDGRNVLTVPPGNAAGFFRLLLP